MQRRGFLKFALAIGLGVTAGMMTLHVTDAAAAPLSPAPLAAQHDLNRAVTSGRLAPQQVRWGRHGHHHWHHRGWGWRHHHRWHRHHWHHRHWHHHHWRRHHW